MRPVTQRILPSELATQVDQGDQSPPLFAIGDSHLYWVQRGFRQEGPSGTPSPRYVFRAPLPPQPCDDEVPCRDPSEICGSQGLCEVGRP